LRRRRANVEHVFDPEHGQYARRVVWAAGASPARIDSVYRLDRPVFRMTSAAASLFALFRSANTTCLSALTRRAIA
jgi:hypothetical protein